MKLVQIFTLVAHNNFSNTNLYQHLEIIRDEIDSLHARNNVKGWIKKIAQQQAGYQFWMLWHRKVL